MSDKNGLPIRIFPRMPGYDYSSPGVYFVTVCTYQRQPVFGDIVNGIMGLNEAGCLAHSTWYDMETLFPTVSIGELIVMPDHIHAIISLGVELRAGEYHSSMVTNQPASLGRVVGAWKSCMTVGYARLVCDEHVSRYEGHLFQKGYFDRVIRDTHELTAISNYICNNPRNRKLGQNDDTGVELNILLGAD